MCSQSAFVGFITGLILSHIISKTAPANESVLCSKTSYSWFAFNPESLFIPVVRSAREAALIRKLVYEYRVVVCHPSEPDMLLAVKRTKFWSSMKQYTCGHWCVVVLLSRVITFIPSII